MTAVGAYHALGFTGCSGSVENVDRIRGRNCFASGRLRAIHRLIPEQGMGMQIFDRQLRSGNQNSTHISRIRDVQRFFKQWQVRNDPAAFDSTTRADDELRAGIDHARCQFFRGKAAENNRVNRSDSGASQHGYYRFWNHRHVDDDTVTFAHTVFLQHASETGRLVQKLIVAVGANLSGHRAVVYQGSLRTSPGFAMPVQGVVTGIDFTAGKPLVKRRS